jgi:hypothetical protein
VPKSIGIRRYRTEGLAWCEQCGGPGREWTRERARQHADQKRHTVRFVINDITAYRPTEGSNS